MLISEAYDLYCDSEIINLNKSLKTLETYINCKKQIINYFGNIKIQLLTKTLCLKYFDHLRSYQKPDSVRLHICALRQVLRFLSLNYSKIVTLNPDLLKVPVRQKRIIKYLTREEFEQFLSLVSQSRKGYSNQLRLRNIAIIKLLFFSGIRVSELCILNRNSINNRKFTMIGKSKNPRLCFINQSTEQSINDYLNSRSDNNPALFLSNYKNRITPNNVRDFFFRICYNHNLEVITPHTLRHSCATYLLEKEVELCYIADILGHQSLTTTKMYLHYNNKKLQHIYDKSMI